MQITISTISSISTYSELLLLVHYCILIKKICSGRNNCIFIKNADFIRVHTFNLLDKYTCGIYKNQLNKYQPHESESQNSIHVFALYYVHLVVD